MPLVALLEKHCRVAAGHAVGDQRTQALFRCALIQERIADERDEGLEFPTRKTDRRLEERVDAREHRFDRPKRYRRSLSTPAFFGS
jgi:hypothetical protein